MCPISHNNFVRYGPIVTQLDMKVAGYDTYIVDKYHRNKVKVTQNVVSVSTYDIPFLRRIIERHYVMCFWSKLSNLDGSTLNLVQWSIGPQNQICSDWGHNVDVMAVIWPFYSSIMSK